MNLRDDGHRTAEARDTYPPHALAAVERLSRLFPEVGFSLGQADGDFSAPATFWAEGGTQVEASIAYQDRFANGMDDRIRAAHLVAFYSHQLSLALGALYLGSGLHAEVTGLRFEDAIRAHRGVEVLGKRFHFRLDLATHGQGGADSGAFEPAFVAHLTPIIAVLKRRTGLSSGAQWRLAADSVAGAFLQIGRAVGDEARGIAEALAIVKRRGSPLFSEKLCYEEITAVGPAGGERLSRRYRMRGGCCLFYRTEGGSFCDACVLLDPDVRRERLAAHLVRNGGA